MCFGRKPLLATAEVFINEQPAAELIGAPSVDWLGVLKTRRGETFGVMAVQTYTQDTDLSRDQDVLFLSRASGHGD
jgi:hypothetical protein